MKCLLVFTLSLLALGAFAEDAKSSSPAPQKDFFERATGEAKKENYYQPCLKFSPQVQRRLMYRVLEVTQLKCYRQGYTSCEGQASMSINYQESVNSCLSEIRYEVKAHIVGKNFDDKAAVKKVTELLDVIHQKAKEGSSVQAPCLDESVADIKKKRDAACTKFFGINTNLAAICFDSKAKTAEVIETCLNISENTTLIVACLEGKVQDPAMIKACAVPGTIDGRLFVACVESKVKSVKEIEDCVRRGADDSRLMVLCFDSPAPDYFSVDKLRFWGK